MALNLLFPFSFLLDRFCRFLFYRQATRIKTSISLFKEINDFLSRD